MPRPLFDSEFLYGFHDPGGEGVMLDAGVPGWVLFTEAVGANPNDNSGRNYLDYANRGLGVIVRLNNGYGGAGTIPFERTYDDFARRCANFVRNSAGAKIWIIGNETNHPIEWPGAEWNWNIFPPAPVSEDKRGEAITPQRYVKCYSKVRAAIKAVPGHADDQVLVAGVAPWNPLTKYDGNTTGDWVKYLADILVALGPQSCDGVAMHAYTHGADPALVRSDAKMANPEFNNRYWHFRVYKDFAGAIPPNMRHLPVYITESNQGDDAWANTNSGWVQAAYGEIDDWNKKNTPKIRALLLYRWPKIGEDRWFIEGKAGVIEDFRLALGPGYKWSTGTGDDGTLAQWWAEMLALESRALALQPDVQKANDLGGKLNADKNEATRLKPLVDAAVQVHTQLQGLKTQVAELERQVAALVLTTMPSVPKPSTTDVIDTLPKHATLVWQLRPATNIKRILIHHTATKPDVKPEALATVHVGQGRPGIAFHYLINGAGVIFETQRLDRIVVQNAANAANTAATADSISIALTGDFSEGKDVEPTLIQRTNAAKLIAWLMRLLGMGAKPEVVVIGRNETGEAVASPGTQWLGGVRYKDKLVADVRTVFTNAQNADAAALRIRVAELEAQVATLQARVAELQPIAAQVPALQQQIAQLQADIAAKQGEINRLQAYINQFCQGGGSLIPRPTIVDLIDKLPKHATKKYSNRTQKITTIVVHHTTGPTTLTPYDIARYHVQSRDWPGVGYHYLISADGTINGCQRHETHSYHAGAANSYGIGVSLIGEFMNGVLPTAPQMQSVSKLIAWLMQELSITDLKFVIGHKEAPEAQTACPGDQWLAGVVWKNQLHEMIKAARVTKSQYFYLLFWDHGDAWAEADYRNAQNYIAHFRPTMGFAVADAMNAQHVLIVGGPLGVSGDDEAKLKAAGVDVHRLAGANEAETQALLDQLAANDTLWPGAPPRSALVAAAGDDELLEDDWYITPEWLAAEVGGVEPPAPPVAPERVRIESQIFPEGVIESA